MPMPECGRLCTIKFIYQILILYPEAMALSSGVQIVAAGLF